MVLEEKAKMWGGIVTVVFHILLLLVMFFVCLEYIAPKEEDGVPVSMGAPDMGGEDLFEPTPETEAPEVAQANPVVAPTPPAPAPAPAPAVAPAVETQDLEQTAAVPVAKKKQEKTSTQFNAAEEEKRKQKELARKEEIRKQKELAAEQAKIKAAEEAKRKAEAEAAAKLKAQQEAVSKRAHSAANVFNKKPAAGNGADANSSGTGSGSKPGTQGEANGAAGGGKGGRGNMWSLQGRQIQGTLPRPAYTANEEGYVIVEIAVDNDGNVVSAEIKKSVGITSAALRNAALSAAKKAKFNKKDGFKANQKGTITYNFKLQ